LACNTPRPPPNRVTRSARSSLSRRRGTVWATGASSTTKAGRNPPGPAGQAVAALRFFFFDSEDGDASDDPEPATPSFFLDEADRAGRRSSHLLRNWPASVVQRLHRSMGRREARVSRPTADGGRQIDERLHGRAGSARPSCEADFGQKLDDLPDGVFVPWMAEATTPTMIRGNRCCWSPGGYRERRRRPRAWPSRPDSGDRPSAISVRDTRRGPSFGVRAVRDMAGRTGTDPPCLPRHADIGQGTARRRPPMDARC